MAEEGGQSQDGALTERLAADDASECDQEEDSHVMFILAEIQRLHRITTRDSDINDRQDLARHQAEQRRRRRRNVRSTSPAVVVDAVEETPHCSLNRISFLFGISIILIICVGTPLVNKAFEHILGVRCFVPNNYLVWEATRPKSDCNFCRGLSEPIILENMSREEFEVSVSSRSLISRIDLVFFSCTVTFDFVRRQ